MPSRYDSSPNSTNSGMMVISRLRARSWGMSDVLSTAIITVMLRRLFVYQQAPQAPNPMEPRRSAIARLHAQHYMLFRRDDIGVVRLSAVDHLDLGAGE